MEQEQQIKAKIMKLLALSGSPNENEAHQALCKAKELMRQHRISERDLLSEAGAFTAETGIVFQETDVTFSKRRASWTLQLANVLAESSRCRAFSRRRGRQQTRTVCLVGFPGDVDLCERRFKRALENIRLWIQAAARRNGELYTRQEFSHITDSYARGYIAGIYADFRRRMGEKEQALVPGTFGEADRAVENMRTERIIPDDEVIRAIFNIGYHDGLCFNRTCRPELREGTDKPPLA